jgi:hypothetical protein
LSHSLSAFCFSYFSDRVSQFCLAILDLDLPIYSSHVAGTTGRSYLVQLYWLRWGLTNSLPTVASNCDLPDLCLPSGWVAHGPHPTLLKVLIITDCWMLQPYF